MSRIVVLDDLAQEGLDLLENAAGIEFEVRTGLKGDDLKNTLNEFDGAICRSGVTLSEEILDGNTRLKAVARAGVGTNNIHSPTATKQGIVVMNTPAGNTISTAEQTVALMMALSRNIAPANQSLIEGRWDRKKFMGTQLAGKTLGIIGLGRIGQTVAERARALEMKIIGFDPFISADRADELGITIYKTVKEMLPHVDYLTVHTPLTDETRGLFNEEALEVIKPGARLINCARGGIYEESAMVAGLKSGKLAGVALDVYENEPCTDSPLFGMDGVLCTPHLGASTSEAQTNVAIEAAELLIAFFKTGVIRHAVNVAPIDGKEMSAISSYLDVSFRLGKLAAQMVEGSPKSCRVIYRGEVASKKTRVLTASFAAGFLDDALERSVNIINAEVLLKERGIEIIEESTSETRDFSSIITVEVETNEKKLRLSATVFGSQMIRLVSIDDYRLDAFLDGTMLIFKHEDVPGLIGAVGTICGKHQLNIAQMSVGRASRGGHAIGILNLDNPPSAEALKEIDSLEAISSTRVVKLPEAGQIPDWAQA